MELDFQNTLPIISLRIEGKIYRLLLDTASEKSYLAYKKIWKSRLRKLPYDLCVKGVGKDKILKEYYLFPSVYFQEAELQDFAFIAKPKDFLFYYLRIDGILGWDFLCQFDFRLSYMKKSFEFLDSDIKEERIIFNIIGSKRLIIANQSYQKILLDTGASMSYLYDNLSGVKCRKSIVLGINGMRVNKLFPKYHVQFGDLYWEKIGVKERKSEVDLQLGTDILEKYDLLVKNSTKEVILVENT